jgi:hypothetical protein
MVLLKVWMASTAVLVLPAVLWDATASAPGGFYLTLGSMVLWVLGLNVAPVILVLGLVVIFRSRGRRVLRAACLAVAMGLSVVGPAVMWGWSTGDNDGEIADLRPNLPVRGLAMWALAAAIVFVTSRLLRTTVFRGRDGRPRRWRREQIIARALAVVLGVAGLQTLLFYVDRPVVTVKNDTLRTLSVQVCPGERCTGKVQSLKPGDTRRFRLEIHRDAIIADSLQVTANGKVVGCLPIGQVLGPVQEEVKLSEAYPGMC